MNLVSFIEKFGTDEACLSHMQSVRWPHGPVCPTCGTINEAVETVKNLGRYAASWIAGWPKRPSSSAALT